MQKKAIVLLSGGLDSITTLALAQQQNYQCYALSFDYGQRHNAELAAAAKIASLYQVIEHKVISLGLGSIGGSALTDSHIAVPDTLQQGIPVTYVPARNTIFLAFALGWAEVLNLQDIFIGVNAIDYSGYPDCRPEFIQAFQALANLATKAGVQGQSFTIHTPLISMSKAEIIKLGLSMDVDYQLTVSCYAADPQGLACNVCDACRLRKIGFNQAGITDPTKYYQSI